jgi:hypothetical protein
MCLTGDCTPQIFHDIRVFELTSSKIGVRRSDQMVSQPVTQPSLSIILNSLKKRS